MDRSSNKNDLFDHYRLTIADRSSWIDYRGSIIADRSSWINHHGICHCGSTIVASRICHCGSVIVDRSSHSGTVIADRSSRISHFGGPDWSSRIGLSSQSSCSQCCGFHRYQACANEYMWLFPFSVMAEAPTFRARVYLNEEGSQKLQQGIDTISSILSSHPKDNEVPGKIIIYCRYLVLLASPHT